MTNPKFSRSVLTSLAVVALCLGYRALAAEKTAATSAPAAGGSSVSKSTAPARLNIAKVDGRRAFAGFARGDAMQQRYNNLMQQGKAAGQAGNKEKAQEIGHQLEKMQEDVRQLMTDAVSTVATERKVDMVLGMRYPPQGPPELDGTVYKSKTAAEPPDLTQEVIERINSLAATRPALDSQPASTEPASIQLQTRPPIRIQPQTPKK